MTQKNYIILTKGEKYAIVSVLNNDDVKYVICQYANDVFGENSIIEKMCMGSTDFSLEEIISYVNNRIYSWEDEIGQIYLLGEKVL